MQLWLLSLLLTFGLTSSQGIVPDLPLQLTANATVTISSFFGPMTASGILYFDYINNYQRIDTASTWGDTIDIARYDLGKEYKIAGGQCEETDLTGQVLYPMSLPPFATYVDDESINGIPCQKWTVDMFGLATINYWITNSTYDNKNLWEPVRVVIDSSNSGVDMNIQYDLSDIVPVQPDPALFDFRQFGCAPAPPPPTFKLSGYVKDATNNKVISGATVALSTGVSAVTGSDGSYTIPNLPMGIYTVTAGANGYLKAQITVNLTSDVNFGTYGDVILAPISPAGVFRVVLTWGSYPADLDSYITTPNNCQVSYSHRVCPTANLDVDARSGFGPETITVTNPTPGSYVYRVVVYSAGVLTNSKAHVTVYGSTGVLSQFSVSDFNSGNAKRWTVFSMDNNGNITPINQFA